METHTEILVPFELQFSDLLILSNPSLSPSLSSEETARLESVSNSLMQALGPSGPGLLAIAGVPRADELRRTLLPLARELALIGNKDRARILKEHGLGSDVSLKDPCRNVSSFALQLKYEHEPSLELPSCDPSNRGEDSDNVDENPTINRLQLLPDLKFKHLGRTFKELSHCMMELGLQLARVCDKYLGCRELEQSILDSCTAKGRLIHYHSVVDNCVLKETNKRIKGTKTKAEPVTCNSLIFNVSKTSGNQIHSQSGMVALDGRSQLENVEPESSSSEIRCWRSSFSNLWQQWHYDYGIFTVLTAPLFMISDAIEEGTCVSSSRPCRSPDGHTYLQVFDSSENKILVVKSSPESFIIQVGEAADILSGGKLRSTLHSVTRPLEIENLSRETFVVFLQPAWSKTLQCPANLLNPRTCQGKLTTNIAASYSKSSQLVQEILRKIPPLSSRLRDGMTFAEFSRETTKQYYGGSGSQSRDK